MSIEVAHGHDSFLEWIGPHSAVTLSRVLKRIACEEKSGDLRVAFGKTTKTIFLKGGFVVFAASTTPKDRLGEAMLERGCISEREFLLASNLMKTEGRRFGEALVTMGFFTPQELHRQLRFQFNRIILSLFKINDGIYTFEERLPPISDNLMVTISIPRLLLDGLSFIPNEQMFLALPSPQHSLRANTRAYSDFDVCSLSPEELTVLRVARNGASLESIVEAVGGDLSRVLRTCGRLYLMDLLKPENEEAIESGWEEKIMDTYVQIQDMTEPGLLRVDPEAERQDIEKAYRMKRLEWTHIQRQVKHDPQLAYQVSEILFHLAAEYHRLLSETPSNGTPAIKAHSLLAAELGPVSSGIRSTSPAKPLKKDPEELLREARVHLTVKEWGQAIPILFKLVDLEPNNASYRGLLAKAMFKHPMMRQNAERHFLEAIRLSPDDAKLHIWLGLYYKSFGMALKATSEFRTALKLDPDNQLAKKALAGSKNRRGHLRNPFQRNAWLH